MDTSWIRVAAAIIEDEGRFLIAKRKEDAHLAGLWEFPGGKCEPGETLVSCLGRELREELGIEVTQPKFFMIQRFQYPKKNIELHFFSCSISHGMPTSLGCQEFRWVEPKDFGAYEFPPADVPVLEKLIGLKK